MSFLCHLAELSLKTQSRRLLGQQASMAGRKVDFVVEQSDELQEAAIDLKAGTHVILSGDESTGRSQVQCEGHVLGQVPADQQQQLRGNSCTCNVRSIRKQDGKITQILVRAVISNSQAKSLPGMHLYSPCSCLAANAIAACIRHLCTVGS